MYAAVTNAELVLCYYVEVVAEHQVIVLVDGAAEGVLNREETVVTLLGCHGLETVFEGFAADGDYRVT